MLQNKMGRHHVIATSIKIKNKNLPSSNPIFKFVYAIANQGISFECPKPD